METKEQTKVHKMYKDLMKYVAWDFNNTKTKRGDGKVPKSYILHKTVYLENIWW